MRAITYAIATAIVLAGHGAIAQTRAPAPAVPPATNGSVTTAAPVPSIVPERVAPADRAGNNTSDPAGPTASTPFSGAPQGGGGGQVSPALRGTESGSAFTTPSLGK